MTLNKLMRTTAVDRNHSINTDKVFKWHYTDVFDHFDSQSTACLASLVLNLQILKAVKAQRLPACVGF